MQGPWTRTDAWILAAVALASERDGATLAEVIGAADAIAHTIPTADELADAFSRLVGCGIVQTEGGRYGVAPEWRPAIAACLRGRGGLFDAVDRCARWLDQSGLEPSEEAAVPLSVAEVQAAYEVYRASLPER